MNTSSAAVFVDGLVGLRCSRGHLLRAFRTDSLDGRWPSTYVVHAGRLYRAGPPAAAPSEHASPTASTPELWRIEGDGVVREHRFTLTEIRGPLTVHLCGRCEACESRLPRAPPPFADVMSEHRVLVSFRLTFRPEEPLHIERVSGSCGLPTAN